MAEQEIPIQTDDLDEKSKERLREALQTAGLKMKESSGPKVVAADVGIVETMIELDTSGVDEKRINDLRSVGFAADRHSKALETVLKGAVPGYGTPAAHGLWVQWLWCEWLQYHGREAFKKRYDVRPWLPGAAQPGQQAQTGGGGASW